MLTSQPAHPDVDGRRPSVADADEEILLDSNGSPARVEPAEWIVCFVPGLRPQWWHRFAHPTHKHVFALRHDGTGRWLLFEPWWTRLMVTNVSTDHALAFLRWASRGDTLTVKEAVPGNGSQLRGWMSCAALTAYLLGRGYLVWTPHALFRRLRAEEDAHALDTRALVQLVRLQGDKKACSAGSVDHDRSAGNSATVPRAGSD